MINRAACLLRDPDEDLPNYNWVRESSGTLCVVTHLSTTTNIQRFSTEDLRHLEDWQLGSTIYHSSFTFLAMPDGSFVEVDGLNGDFYSGFDDEHVGCDLNISELLKAISGFDENPEC